MYNECNRVKTADHIQNINSHTKNQIVYRRLTKLGSVGKSETDALYDLNSKRIVPSDKFL